MERVGRRRYRKIRANGEQGRSVRKEPGYTFNHKIQNIFPCQAAPPFMLMDGKLSEKRLSSVAGCHMATEVRRTLHSLGHTFTLDRLSLFGVLRVSKSDKRRDGAGCVYGSRRAILVSDRIDAACSTRIEVSGNRCIESCVPDR